MMKMQPQRSGRNSGWPWHKDRPVSAVNVPEVTAALFFAVCVCVTSSTAPRNHRVANVGQDATSRHPADRVETGSHNQRGPNRPRPYEEMGVPSPKKSPPPSQIMSDAALPGGVARRIDAVYLSTHPEDITRRLMVEADELATGLLGVNDSVLATTRAAAAGTGPLAAALVSRAAYGGQLGGADLVGPKNDSTAPLPAFSGSPNDTGPGGLRVVVGVISARDHFAQRQAIRETWGHPSVLRQHRVALRFVVGNASCKIPPRRRVSPYGCERERVERYAVGRELRAHDATAVPTDRTSMDLLRAAGIRTVGTDFIVKHWITVTHLGVYVGDSAQQHRRRAAVVVTLWDTDTGHAVLNLTLSPPTKESDWPEAAAVHGGFAFLAAPRGLVLPVGFAGTVSASGVDGLVAAMATADFGRSRVHTDDGGGLIEILPTARVARVIGDFPRELRAGIVGGGGESMVAATLGYRVDIERDPLLHTLEWVASASFDTTQLAVRDQLQLRWPASEPRSVMRYPSREAWVGCDGTNAEAMNSETDGSGNLRTVLRGLPIGEHYFADPEQCRLGHLRLVVEVVDPAAEHAAGLAFARGAPVDSDAAWITRVEAADSHLAEEAAIHRDLVVVPLLDTYRAVPEKVLQFYLWAAGTRAKFALKTDDDCFVDLGRVVGGLAARKLYGRPKVWWSQFREGWPVARQGKWAERAYTAMTYPAFGCGAGGVLSRDLVDFLALNAGILHRHIGRMLTESTFAGRRYQGEDTSTGIWLAAAHPQLERDSAWSCFKRCSPGVLTSPEHSPPELRAMWANLVRCDNPCGCPAD